MANELIKSVARAAGVRLWQIADKLKMNDGNFSRKLRKELPVAEQERILAIINKLKESNHAANENN